MCRPKSHSLNGDNPQMKKHKTRENNVLHYIHAAVAGVTRNEQKMRENLRMRNLKSIFHGINLNIM
jgi:hypothetical protein